MCTSPGGANSLLSWENFRREESLEMAGLFPFKECPFTLNSAGLAYLNSAGLVYLNFAGLVTLNLLAWQIMQILIRLLLMSSLGPTL